MNCCHKNVKIFTFVFFSHFLIIRIKGFRDSLEYTLLKYFRKYVLFFRSLMGHMVKMELMLSNMWGGDQDKDTILYTGDTSPSGERYRRHQPFR